MALSTAVTIFSTLSNEIALKEGLGPKKHVLPMTGSMLGGSFTVVSAGQMIDCNGAVFFNHGIAVLSDRLVVSVPDGPVNFKHVDIWPASVLEKNKEMKDGIYMHNLESVLRK